MDLKRLAIERLAKHLFLNFFADPDAYVQNAWDDLGSFARAEYMDEAADWIKPTLSDDLVLANRTDIAEVIRAAESGRRPNIDVVNRLIRAITD